MSPVHVETTSHLMCCNNERAREQYHDPVKTISSIRLKRIHIRQYKLSSWRFSFAHGWM